jgi:starch-binding outer membrane protein, SusD/RagB family
MKIIIKSALLLSSFIAFYSCKKQLDLKPTDTLNETVAFRTIADAQLGANEVYGRYGTYLNTIYASAIVTDEVKIGVDNNGQGALTYRFQYASDNGDVTGAYNGFYSLIDQANRVLGALPNVIATSTEEPRRNILKGQLLAMRALAHYDLLQLYSKKYNTADPKGVAIMLTSNPLAKPARSSVGAAIAQIETDLNDAYNLLPAVTAASFSDTVMNRVNIDAYRARIALYKEDYNAAITYATNVINSAVKPLATGTSFTDIWTDNSPAEVLFRIRYSTSTALGSLWTTTGNLVYLEPSDKLKATFTTSDIRKNAYIGTVSGKTMVNKYFVSPKGGRVVDIKACRIAEMYLIRAEAYAKLATPNITAGTADLNALRTQRITGYLAATFPTAADLITAVLAERYKELCFEGFRSVDLKRNDLPVARLASDVFSTTWQNLPANDYKRVFPIPQAEMLANPNMVQNDNY